MNIPYELEECRQVIHQEALDYGLDFYETIFEILDYGQLNEVAAYGGFPTRYPHWRHGMGFERLDKEYRYGLSKIYELVINNNPCYAYLLGSNSLTENKLVIAHVYGHSDFFKNNYWFSKTNRKMMDRMANHATRVRRMIDERGQEDVEDFLDRALSLENLVDLHGLMGELGTDPEQEEDDEPNVLRKLKSRDYMDPYINPPEYLERQKARMEEDEQRQKKHPAEPVRDVMRFLLENAPLERWECDLLDIAREEALYFAPQRCTKIMNEGWASYWHRKIMTEKILTDEDFVDYADTMSSTLAGGGAVNPYKIGIELFMDIEDRWNKGRHGLEFDRCADFGERQVWDTNAMTGRDQIFFARKVHNDVTFIDEFLTEEFCHSQKLFVYQWNPRTKRKEIATRDFPAVKEQFLRQLANGGAPVIEVVDSNHANRGELYLTHRWDGQDLRADYTSETLRNVQRIWKRPVLLETRTEGRRQLFFTDGEKEKVQDLGTVDES